MTKKFTGLSVVPIAIDQQVDAGAAVLSDQVDMLDGVTVDGEYTVHGVIPRQPPIDRTMPVTDFYLGPCDSKRARPGGKGSGGLLAAYLI